MLTSTSTLEPALQPQPSTRDRAIAHNAALNFASIKKTAKRFEASDAILESLIAETHHAASRTVVIASWANALEDPEFAKSAPTIRALVPGDPAVMVTMRRWIDTTALDSETLDDTSDFFHTLATARNAFNRFFTEANQIGYVRAGILHATVLQETWRLTTERAIDAVASQTHAIDTALPQIYSSNARVLLGLLHTVKTGGTPCINPDATIRLPDLPNQRSATRRMLLENCRVKTNRQTFSAFARDVSIGGLGLQRVPQMTPGRHVSIVLPTGRALEGTVRWYRNASAGVKFIQDLDPDDALLTA